MDLSSKRIGFVGAGNMACAIALGMIKETVSAKQLLVSNPSAGKFKRFNDAGIRTTHDNMEVMRQCDIVLICVKPQIFPLICEELASSEPTRPTQQLVISIMAAVTIEKLQEVYHWATVVRTMPNTPMLVGAGVLLYCRDEQSRDEDLETVRLLFSSSAECVMVSEQLIDVAQAVAACGTGYMFTAMDAMADGAVKMGLPRATALRLAAKTMVGAGEMHLQTGEHPGVMKDAVTSPGGVTITALHALDKGGFRAALIDAVQTATERSQSMTQKK